MSTERPLDTLALAWFDGGVSAYLNNDHHSSSRRWADTSHLTEPLREQSLGGFCFVGIVVGQPRGDADTRLPMGFSTAAAPVREAEGAETRGMLPRKQRPTDARAHPTHWA